MNDIERRTLIGAAGIGAIAALSKAGPLNPPAGAVTPTGKTTQELFDKVAAVESRTAVNATNTPGTATALFRINQPGSYYLTGDIIASFGKHGIEIAVSDVTLDLNGFEMAGFAGMGAFNGISIVGSGSLNIKVRNGSVSGWGNVGVDLLNSSGCSVSSICAKQNTAGGIRVGNDSLITDCISPYNSAVGYIAGTGCTITGCIASNNGTIGINTGAGCTITTTTVHGNTTTGILAGTASTVADCTVYGNGGTGIQVASGSSVTRCTLRSNGSDGINAGASCLITNNLAGLNGITVVNTANIHITGGDNRVEGNNLTQGNNGLLVDVAGNVIVRNTASGNTVNWVIAANNVFGPIVDRTAPGSAAVSGNAAASSLGTTDANANFTY